MKVFAYSVGLLVLVFACFVQAEPDEGNRYQVIIDRKPFYEPPVDQAHVAANAAAAAQIEQFAKSIKMVAIKIEEDAVWVGLVNQAAGNKGYYLTVGDKTSDGIELVEANFEQESALLKKDGQSVWIYMNGSPQKIGATTTPSVPVIVSSSGPSSERHGRGDRSTGRPSRERYLEIIKNREKAKRDSSAAAVSPPVKPSAEELEKNLKEYQLDAIRKGRPPLPIPLTQEMDDQLVKEGVLPPLPAETPAISGQ